MLGDIAGLARKLEDGQSELTDRLDRIIQLLEAILATGSGGAAVRSITTRARTG